MGTDRHRLLIELDLEPIWHQDPPRMTLALDNLVYYAGFLEQPTVFTIDQRRELGPCQLSLTFENKVDSDTIPSLGKDKAIVIKGIKLNQIQSPRFVWQGKYYPVYPQPWYQEQVDAGTIPPAMLENSTYIGWNGTWKLDLVVPIFTWIHQVEDLGWIYD